MRSFLAAIVMFYVGGCASSGDASRSPIENKAEPSTAFLTREYPSQMVTLVDHVRLNSEPSGAAVYLIPKIEYERDKELGQRILKDPSAGARYRVMEGLTPVETTTREMVYIAIFILKERAFIGEGDFRPGQRNEMFVKFP
jgi:hypothetical protein